MFQGFRGWFQFCGCTLDGEAFQHPIQPRNHQTDCEVILQQLVEYYSSHPELWHNMVYIYIYIYCIIWPLFKGWFSLITSKQITWKMRWVEVGFCLGFQDVDHGWLETFRLNVLSRSPCTSNEMLPDATRSLVSWISFCCFLRFHFGRWSKLSTSQVWNQHLFMVWKLSHCSAWIALGCWGLTRKCNVGMIFNDQIRIYLRSKKSPAVEKNPEVIQLCF